MVVYYPRTVWKNIYAEHEVTGQNIQFKSKKKQKLTKVPIHALSASRPSMPARHKKIIAKMIQNTLIVHRLAGSQFIVNWYQIDIFHHSKKHAYAKSTLAYTRSRLRAEKCNSQFMVREN